MTNQDSTRPDPVDPLVLTAPARAGQRTGAWTLDVLLPVLLALGAVLSFATGNPLPGSLFGAATIALVWAASAMTARTGRSLGRLAAGTRAVDRRTGAAAGSSLVPALFSGRLGTYDLRRGRDPFAPALSPFVFPAPAPAPARPAMPSRGRVPVIHLDSGERLPLESAVVLGRNPSAPADAPADVYQWPDLSRTLSKSHARLEWDGRSVWVTDLGSTNGTTLRIDERMQPLLPFQRTLVPPDARLELGDRDVTVRTLV